MRKEWSDVFKLDTPSSYKRLKQSADDLYSRSVRISGDNHNGKQIRWLSAEEYRANDGYVEISFGRGGNDLIFFDKHDKKMVDTLEMIQGGQKVENFK